MKLEEVNNLSAYAVYKNLVPGVAVYQDTNNDPGSKGSKQKRKSAQQQKAVPAVIAEGKKSAPVKPERASTSNGIGNKGGAGHGKAGQSPAGGKGVGASTPSKGGPSPGKGGPSPNGKAGPSPGKGGNTAVVSSTAGPSPSKDTPQTSVVSASAEKKKKKKLKRKAESNDSAKSPAVKEGQEAVAGTTTPATKPGKLGKANAKSDSATPPKKAKKSMENGVAPAKASSSSSTPEKTPEKGTPKKNKNKKGKKSSPKAVPQVEVTKNSSSTPQPESKKNKGKKSKEVVARAPAELVQASNSTPEQLENEVPLSSLFSSKPVENSVEHGKNLFQWLVSPTPVTKFMSDNWEKAPLLIKRSDPDYYKWLLSSSQFDEIMRRNIIRYGKNLDITSFTDGQRETHNPVGRAMPAAVWDYYSNGCSIRFLNPQTYVKPLWRLNALLQEYFGTFVGANVYLTPADSQGFAPHYDDIEAFVLQVEGRKHWKVYKPRSKDEDLARFSSPNFSEQEDNIGTPVLDVILEEGDLLYFPRGYIHQAKAVGEHSLHITISCYQLNCWGDLMKEYLSSAVDLAMASSIDFRKGLPTDYLSYMGAAHENTTDKKMLKQRKAFMQQTKTLAEQLLRFTTPDAAADQLGKKFMWDSLPPYLTAREKGTTSINDGEFMEEGEVYNRCELEPDVEVKLLRKHCIRLVFEENSFRLYFTLENSLEYHGEDAQFVEIPADSQAAIAHLIAAYPNFVKIDDLPITDVTAKVQLIADLWEKGLILTKNPLVPTWDDSTFMEGTDEDDDESEDLGSQDSDDDEEEEEEDSEGNSSYTEEDSDDSTNILNGFDYPDYDEFIEDNFGEGADSDLEIDSSDDGGNYRDMDDDDDDDGDEETEESDEDHNGLGKSYIEEVHGSSEEDEVPQLVAIPATTTPSSKSTPKKGKQNNKKGSKK